MIQFEEKKKKKKHLSLLKDEKKNCLQERIR